MMLQEWQRESIRSSRSRGSVLALGSRFLRCQEGRVVLVSDSFEAIVGSSDKSDLPARWHDFRRPFTKYRGLGCIALAAAAGRRSHPRSCVGKTMLVARATATSRSWLT